MAIPWLLALRAIPWGTILAAAPSILSSADALRAKSQVRPGGASATDLEALGDRIAALEQRDRESAELIARLTAQVSALAAAGEVLEARARWLLLIAIAALTLAVVAAGFVVFTRG